MTSADVMDASAAVLNDTAKQVFTYAAQLPYLNIALQELQEVMELNNVPYSNKVSSAIVVAAGVVLIDSSTTPALPTDLVEIQKLSERTTGTSDDFLDMTRCEFLPLVVETTSSLIYWTWQNQGIRFLGANISCEVKIQYIAALLTAVTTTTATIALFNSKSFLQYRTAALCAQYIGENDTRAADLNNNASGALDRFLGINTKGRQSLNTRRRPFRAGYKARGDY